MKYLYIGLAILVLCLALCITTTAVLDRYTGEAISLLQQAQEQAGRGDYPAAEAQVEEAMTFWERHHGFFGTVLRHAEADQINSTFRALREHARNASEEDFSPTCADLIGQIEHLSDMEQPSYYNILTIRP